MRWIGMRSCPAVILFHPRAWIDFEQAVNGSWNNFPQK